MVFFTLALCFGTTKSTILQVPQSYPSIQAAIDAASPGDEVVVDAGTYPENLDFRGKAIIVRSSGGPVVTIIDGRGLGPVVWFHSGEPHDAILRDFTITGGQADWGGGILCDSSSPTIEGNVFDANVAAGGGGGLYCQSASPRIFDNQFSGNHADFFGGGGVACDAESHPVISGNSFSYNSSPVGLGGAILCDTSDVGTRPTVISANIFTDNSASVAGAIACSGSSPVISGNLFSRNVAWYGEGGAIYCFISAPTIESNLMVENRADTWSGGAIGCYQSSPILRNNTFCANEAAISGGAIFTHDQSVPVIVSSIFWQNSAATFPEIYGQASVSYSDVDGGWLGPGNIDTDPLFQDASQSNYALRPDSPCLDAGDPAPIGGKDVAQNPRRLDGDLNGIATVDMGAFEFGNVHIEVTGSATPGGSLAIHSTGDTNLSLALLIGTALGESWVSPFGPVYLRFDRPWLWAHGSWSDLIIPIPSAIGPMTIVLQELAYDPVAGTGNTSNAVIVDIE
jgi:predicted outer membrane repeat protein